MLLIEDPLSADSRIAELNITLPPPEPNADWPQSGGNPAHAMQHLSAAETITEAWSTKIGAAAGGRSWILAGPVISGGVVYAVDADGEAVALSAADGKQIWRFEAENVEEIDRLLSGAISVADGRAYLVSGNGTIFGLDAGGGKELWRRQLQAPMRTAPTLIAGKVLVPTDDSQLYVLDGATGDVEDIELTVVGRDQHLAGDQRRCRPPSASAAGAARAPCHRQHRARRSCRCPKGGRPGRRQPSRTARQKVDLLLVLGLKAPDLLAVGRTERHRFAVGIDRIDHAAAGSPARPGSTTGRRRLPRSWWTLLP